MIIGITGGIGSGKTTVANFFRDYNIPIYIADEAAKNLMLKKPVKDEIIKLFGKESYHSDGQLNRKYIASKVFDNKTLLDKLNHIVHPCVRQDFKDWTEKQTSPYVLYEAAILYESSAKNKFYDYSILVIAPLKKRIDRLKKRDHSTEAEIKSRMENQWSDERKKPFADWVIENDDLQTTKCQVANLHSLLLKL